MRVLRTALGVMAVATALSVGVASAANLGAVPDGALGSGAAAVQRCDADGVTVAFAYSGHTVTSVTVGGLHDNCSGATLSYVLVDATGARVGASNGSVTVPAGRGTAPALAVATPQPTSANVARVHVLLLGGKP